MCKLKPKYYFFLLVFLLLPLSLRAAWTEPAQAPTGGNAAVPVYSQGSGQAITGSLVVTEISGTGLQVTGEAVGIQGNSENNAIYGNTTTGGTGGYAGVYGTAFDANDFAGNFSGGAGIAIQGGAMPTIAGIYVLLGGGEIVSTGGYTVGTDIILNSQARGIAWPRESDGQSLYGVYVSATGEMQLRGHGGGINLTDQNNASRLTVSEAGATNVVTGPLTVAGTAVCLSDGTNCPAPPAPPAAPSSYWDAVSGTNDIQANNSGAVRIKKNLWFSSTVGAENFLDFDPTGNSISHFLIKSGSDSLNAFDKQHLRINLAGETLIGSDVFIGNNNAQGVAVMTPYANPAVNTSWAIRGKNTPTIEAVPGGGVASVGDINLKSGTLKLKYLNSDAGDVMLNDTLDVQFGIQNSVGNLDVSDDLKVTGGGAFGGHDPNVNYKVTTPSLYSDMAYFGVTLYSNVLYSPTVGANNIWLGDNNDTIQVQGNLVVGGATLTVGGKDVCLEDGTNCLGGGVVGGNQNLLEVLQDGADASAFAGPTSIGGIVNLGGSNLNSTQTAANHWYLDSKRGVRFHLDSDNNSADTFEINRGDNTNVFSVDENGAVTVPGSGGLGVGIAPLYGLHVKTTAGVDAMIQGSLYVMDDVGTGAGFLCLGVNCKTGWDWTTSGNNIYSSNSGSVGIGQAPPADPNDVKLIIKPANGEEGLRVVASDYSPFAIRNAADGADLFRVKQDGSVCIGTDCKTTWGPNYSDSFRKPLGTPPDGQDYTCATNPVGQPVTGYVMVGIENSAIAEIICARMW